MNKTMFVVFTSAEKLIAVATALHEEVLSKNDPEFVEAAIVWFRLLNILLGLAGWAVGGVGLYLTAVVSPWWSILLVVAGVLAYLSSIMYFSYLHIKS